MITNKNIFLFVALIFCSTARATKRHYISNRHAQITGQKGCDEFFDKIRSGIQEDASKEDKAYFEAAKKITSLHCSFADGNKIRELPPEIGLLKKLESLDLFCSKLKTLPPEIGNLENLVKLNLRKNYNIVLPKEIENLQKLEVLNLSETITLNQKAIGKFPICVCSLLALKELNISFCPIRNIIPPEIANLQNLEVLDLARCKFTAIPPEIWKLKKLKSLELNGNWLTSIPAPTENHPSLEKLDLSGNHLTTLPNEIDYLINLQELGIYFNNLTSLPHTIGNLINLRELSVGHNKLTKLPATIGNLTNLRELYVRNNKLTSIHSGIGHLKTPCKIFAEDNHLLTLPRKLKENKSLEVYAKHQMKYTSPESHYSGDYKIPDNLPVPSPDENGILFLDHPANAQLLLTTLTHKQKLRYYGQQKMTGIRCIEFFDGVTLPELQHSTYPDNFCKAKNMYSIKCTSECQAILFQIVLALSKNYRAQMEPAQILDMSGIHLQELSPAIAHLPNLERIFLQDNQLYELPKEIGSLNKLTILNLANNALETLPQSLENLVELRSIILDGNPLDSPGDTLPHFENLPKMEIISTGGRETDIRFLEQCQGVAPQTRLYTLLGSKFLEDVQAQ